MPLVSIFPFGRLTRETRGRRPVMELYSRFLGLSAGSELTDERSTASIWVPIP